MNIAEILGISSVSDVNVTNQTENVENTNEDFASYLNASTTTMDDIFNKASETYNVPVALLKAMAKQESNFDPNATSSSGAQGVMQLMPATAASLGVTNAYDPEQNIMASAKLLAAHLKKFNGDFTLAAAAYNAGSGAVKKYGGVPPYSETQNYVKKINKYMKEGVSVPDKSYSVKDTGKYTQNQIESTAASTDQSSDPLKNAAAATEKDLDELRVTVGTGDDMTTMTYGAYLRYLELGSLGVG